MKIKSTLVTSSSLYNLSGGSRITLLENASGYTFLEKINIKYKFDTVRYNYDDTSRLVFTTDDNTSEGIHGFNFNQNSDIIFSLGDGYNFSGSLYLEGLGNNPTVGNGSLLIDVYYDTINIDDMPVTTFSKTITGTNNLAVGEYTTANGYNTKAGSKYTTTTNITSGSASPIFVPSTVTVPGLPSVGSKILLDDSAYSNIYGKIILDVDSYIQEVGPPEQTSIYLTNTTISTPTASIYFIGYPDSGNSGPNGNYSSTEGLDTMTFSDYSRAAGVGTITAAVGQVAIGQYNKLNSTDLFIIGNGDDDNSRSNIVSISTNSVNISGSLKVSGSITGSLLGSASFATTSSFSISSSFARSASYATNTATASFIPNLVPGNSGEILFSGGSNNISSTGNFVYNSNRDSVTLDRNEDYNGFTFTVPIDRYAIGHKNSAFNINSLPAYCRNYYFVYQVTDNTTALLSTLTAKSGTNLSIYGLKCDYCLTISDPNVSPVEILGTRTGIFTCAWDSNGTNVQLTDDVKSIGDTTIGELTNVTFTINWSGDDIQLNIDTTGVLISSNIGFMGYFTLFTS